MNSLEASSISTAHPIAEIVTDITGTPYHADNKLEILQNGDQIFPAMLGAIRSATSHIEFLSFVFERGQIAATFIEALAERSRAGLTVRVLFDTVGAASLSSRLIWKLEQAGARVGWFRPGHPHQLHKFNNRTHRKILLIDSRLGFTGGIGVADMWTPAGTKPSQWRETHCRIEGPVCIDLHRGFAENWLEATSEVLPYNVSAQSHRPGFTAIHATVSSARRHPTLAHRLVTAAISTAGHRLWITTPYFVPTKTILHGLIDAAHRGVDVRILTNGRHTDTPPARFAGRASYQSLLAAGIKVYEYQPTMHHAKIITVDQAWATIGSINLDPRSLILNDELNIDFTDSGLIASLDRHFLADLDDSLSIQPSHWHQRSWLDRLAESGSNLFRHQL